MIEWCAPVGTPEERATGLIWPGKWEDATGFAVTYEIRPGVWTVHTGADLNLNAPSFDADAHKPVVSIGNGVVMRAELPPGSHSGNVITIDYGVVQARYWHIENMLVHPGDVVTTGQQIASVGNANGWFPWHLHFDITDKRFLGDDPTNWPGTVKGVQALYLDPKQWLQEHVMEPTKYTIISPTPLTLYATPLVTSYEQGAEVLVSDLQTIEATNTVWAHVQLTEAPLEGDGWIVAAVDGVKTLRLTTPPPPETMWTRTIANLRSGPGTGSTIVKVLAAGVRLSVSGHYAGTGAPDWALVQEPVGYIARTLLTATEPTTPPPVIDPVETMQVVSDIGLKIRAQPTVASSQIGSLANGAIVKVRGSTLAGDYHFAALVDYPIAGWVAREFLRPT